MTRPKKTTGSKKSKAAKVVLEPTPNPDPMNVLDGLHVYDPDVLQAKQEAFEENGPNTYVIKDEWCGKIQESNPFDETAEPYKKANPDKHLRYISPAHCKRRGRRDYLPVRDRNDQIVRVGLQELSFIPLQVHEQRKAVIEKRTADMRAVAQENFHEQSAKLERDSGGAVRAVTGQRIVDGVPIGVTTRRGHLVS